MLTKSEIYKVVNRYIEVHGGYLGDFSYRTHSEFYPEFCNLDIDTSQFSGTTREKFIKILETSSAHVQAKILKGVLEKYPPESFPLEVRDLKNRIAQEIVQVVQRLENSPVDAPNLEITSEVVERAIQDAYTLIQKNGPTSAVDRVHTVMHGYLEAVCQQRGIPYPVDPTMNQLLKALKEHHPALSNEAAGQQEIDAILKSIANVFDKLNPIRNKVSVAHPNPILLGEEEAMFAINIAHTILQYLNSKFKMEKEEPESIPWINLDDPLDDIPF